MVDVKSLLYLSTIQLVTYTMSGIDLFLYIVPGMAVCSGNCPHPEPTATHRLWKHKFHEPFFHFFGLQPYFHAFWTDCQQY